MRITVRCTDDTNGTYRFVVAVSEEGDVSSHAVAVSEDYYQKLAAGRTPTELVEDSFRFLLERERKEAILEEFELPVIQKYFPEYEETIQQR